jgi:hypothetical protein
MGEGPEHPGVYRSAEPRAGQAERAAAGHQRDRQVRVPLFALRADDEVRVLPSIWSGGSMTTPFSLQATTVRRELVDH